MSTEFTDLNTGRYLNGVPCPLADLPRGLVRPPQRILDHVAGEKARLQPYYTDEYARQALEDLTLAYYYAGLPVAYRSTPDGLEVLAIGWEETSPYWETPVEGVRVQQA